jgi:glutathionyl-hydroquinone reductase
VWLWECSTLKHSTLERKAKLCDAKVDLSMRERMKTIHIAADERGIGPKVCTHTRIYSMIMLDERYYHTRTHVPYVYHKRHCTMVTNTSDYQCIDLLIFRVSQMLSVTNTKFVFRINPLSPTANMWSLSAAFYTFSEGFYTT